MKKLFFLMSAMFVLALTSFGQSSQTELAPPPKTLLTGDISSKIEITVDDFSGEITLTSPIGQSLLIEKIIRKDTVYYLRLVTTGSTCVVDGKGLIVLFTDGTKWEKSDSEIDCEVGNGGDFDYSAFIQLSSKDLNLFSTKIVSKFKLYIFEASNFIMFDEKYNIIYKIPPVTDRKGNVINNQNGVIKPFTEDFVLYANAIKKMK
jgi:hypothetical protein